MRLIDADKLLYDDITDENGDTYMVVHAPRIDNAPTIEAVPVVHAEWKRTDITTEDGWAMYCCSNCNFHTEYYYSLYAKPEYNFCPNCGADMRKALL